MCSLTPPRICFVASESVTSTLRYSASFPVARIASRVRWISNPRSHLAHSSFHSFNEIFSPDSSIIRSRNAIFSSSRTSGDAPSIEACSVFNRERPRRTKRAPAPSERSAVSIMHAAVTPAAPPDTTHISSEESRERGASNSSSYKLSL